MKFFFLCVNVMFFIVLFRCQTFHRILTTKSDWLYERKILYSHHIVNMRIRTKLYYYTLHKKQQQQQQKTAKASLHIPLQYTWFGHIFNVYIRHSYWQYTECIDMKNIWHFEFLFFQIHHIPISIDRIRSFSSLLDQLQ